MNSSKCTWSSFLAAIVVSAWALWGAMDKLELFGLSLEIFYTGVSLLFLYVILVRPHLKRRKGYNITYLAERWLVSLSFWVPRKYREAIAGDILEDCREMRENGFSENRIRIHVLWQLAIGVIALWPEAIGSAVAAVVKRVWSVRK